MNVFAAISLKIAATLFFALMDAFARFAGQTVPVGEVAALCLIGLLGGISHLLMTESFRRAPASATAPFDYVAILWAIAFGYMMFGEVPGPLVIAGAAVVVSAGLFVIWRER